MPEKRLFNNLDKTGGNTQKQATSSHREMGKMGGC
jgi:hypothetical protein